MLYGLYLSASGLRAQELRQSITSNNLANAETVGFKRDLALMQARAQASQEDFSMMRYAIPQLRNQGGGVNTAGAGVDLSQGMLKQTDNQTDLAIDGKGFFQLKGDTDDKPILTRDGQFLINDQGVLVSAANARPVLASNGQEIVLNPSLPVTVTSGGMVSQADGTGAQLGLRDADSRDLIKLGGNMMTVEKPEMLKDVAGETHIRQFHVEQSGVDPVVEMVGMMEGQRAFEANAKMISYQDTTLSELNTIGKVA